MIDGKSIGPRKLAPVGRLGGPRYCGTHEIFALEPADIQPDRADPNAGGEGRPVEAPGGSAA